MNGQLLYPLSFGLQDTRNDDHDQPSEDSFVNVVLLSLVRIRLEDNKQSNTSALPKRNFKTFQKVNIEMFINEVFVNNIHLLTSSLICRSTLSMYPKEEPELAA